MFCDLVGSTALAERLDPEALREVLLAYQRYCSEIIERFGGHIARYMGDGLLVYFGYPRAHEDDARRAALAALEMAECVPALQREVGAVAGVRPALRIGIDTGLVVVAEMGAGQRREPHDVVGEAPNLAARLQALAEPNTVVVSAATYRLIRGYVDVSGMGEHRLKGVGRPVELFRLLGKAAAETRLQAAPLRTAMVGREPEQRALLEAWERARGGSAQVVTIEGDAGMGKSRLVELATDHVTRTRGCYLVLQCSPHHVNTILHPVVRLIERTAATEGGEPTTRWARLCAFLESFGPMPPEDLSLFAGLLAVPPPADVPGDELTPERRRERTFQAVLAWLRRMASTSPLLLAVEDMHWADPSTVELVTRLTERPAGHSMTVLTARPEGRFDPGPGATTLRLGPLAGNDRARMVHRLTGDLGVPAAVREVIAERSDGIPLYIEELARMLATGGDGPGGGPGDAHEVDVPPTLHDLLVARLEQYPQGKAVAQVIATVGQPTPLSLLSRLVAGDDVVLRRQLEVLVAGGILEVDHAPVEDRYGFRHSLIRDTAYHLQLRRRRVQLHGSIADTIEDSFPELAEAEPELVARHHLEGGRPARAAHHWYRAGVRAADLAAHTEAIEHHRRALAVIDDLPAGEVPADLQLAAQSALGASLLVLRGYASPDVERAYGRAAELSGPRPDVATIMGLWSYYTVRGEHRTAVGMAVRALDAARSGGGRRPLVQGHGLVGYQRCFLGDYAAARDHLEQAVGHRGPDDAAGMTHDPGVAALALLAPTLFVLGHPRPAAERMAEALADAEALAFPVGPFTRAYVHSYAAWYHQLASRPSQAATHATRAIEIAAQYGYSTWLGAATLHLAIANAASANPSEWVPLIETGLDMWTEAGARLFRPYFLAGLAAARRRAGDLDGALEAASQGLAQVEDTGERIHQAELHRIRGQVLADADRRRPEQAAAELAEAVAVAHRQGALTLELRAATALHVLEAAHGRGDVTGPPLRAVLASFADGDEDELVDLAEARAALEPPAR